MQGNFREALECWQVAFYFAASVLAVAIALVLPVDAAGLIEPALALMLFVTFLQVPVATLGRALLDLRFLSALVISNFVAVPLLVAGLLLLAPADPLIRLGVLLVLLTPCVDYVVTFSKAGGANAGSLLAATPLLLLLQLALLPIYLALFLGDSADGLVRVGPFLQAFLSLIVLPLAFAALLQGAARRSTAASHARHALDHLPVPATALVLFLVFLSVVPQLGLALSAAGAVAPLYLAFAATAPVVGWIIARAARLPATATRAVAFSTATRNSLVILPLALAVPGAMPILPTVIVTQTIVELLASLVYILLMPRLGNRED